MQPLGKLIGPQLDRALGVDGISFDWTDLGAGDISGRARALQGMINAGIDLDRAMALSGLMVSDNDD